LAGAIVAFVLFLLWLGFVRIRYLICRPDDEQLVMEALVRWASTKHSSWFDRSRYPARVRADFPDWFIPVEAYPHSEED
jgi:hypothetical protein